MMNDAPEDNATGTVKKAKKKINGLIILGVILLVTFSISYRPTIARIHCDEDTLAGNPEVIMFGTWWCPYCYQARRHLHDNNISYCEYDIERSDVGKQLYDETRSTAIPALIIGRYLLQGFNADQIDEALRLSRENDAPRK